MTENKRFKCSACGYPMRVIAETEDMYRCYCANCKVDRCVPKYSLKQFKRDIERGKGISNDLILDMVDRTISENEQLKEENQSWLKTASRMDTIHHEDREYCEKLYKENEQLKQSIKEIDDAELHLKQIILKRIDDYIWEWEDEGTQVAQVLRELRDEIKGDDAE